MPASTSKVNDNEYTKILQKADFEPASYEEIAKSLMENGVRQMYHALVNEDDIQTLFTIPNLKIFWICSNINQKLMSTKIKFNLI